MYCFPDEFSVPRRKGGSLVYLRLVISVFYFHYLFFKDVSVKKGEFLHVLHLKKEAENVLFGFDRHPCVIPERYSSKIWMRLCGLQTKICYFPYPRHSNYQ